MQLPADLCAGTNPQTLRSSVATIDLQIMNYQRRYQQIYNSYRGNTEQYLAYAFYHPITDCLGRSVSKNRSRM